MIKEVDSKKYGFRICFDGEDDFVGLPVSNDIYEPFESELFLVNVRKNSVVFDIGANIGYYSLLAALKMNSERRGLSRLVGNKGRVYSFEPNIKNFLFLQKNIEINGFKNVDCYNYAVGDQNGETQLYLSSENQGDHQLYSSENRGTELCRVLSVDSFIEEHGVVPDVIKIDTQGYDLHVLKGMEGLLESGKSLVLFTEFWDHGNRKGGISSLDYYEFLKNYFGDVYFIDEKKRSIYSVNFDFIMQECSRNDNTMHANLFCKK